MVKTVNFGPRDGGFMSRADVAAALTMPRRDAHVLFYVYLFLPSPLFLLLAYPRVDVFVCLLSPRRPRGVWAAMMRRGSSLPRLRGGWEEVLGDEGFESSS